MPVTEDHPTYWYFAIEQISSVFALYPMFFFTSGVVEENIVTAGREKAVIVVGAMTSIDTVGPILAGLFLYREPYPRSWEAFVLLVGLALALGGARAISVKHRLRR